MSLSQRYGLVVLITVLGTAVGLLGSYITNSWSVWSDALHFFGDGVPFMLGWALLLFRLDIQRRQRTEEIILYLNMIFLGVVSFSSFMAGIQRYLQPEEVASSLFWFGCAELIANILQLGFAQGLKEAHVNLRAFRSQMLHLAADVFASVIVIVSGVVIWTTHWAAFDGIATVGVGVVAAWAAFECARPHKHDHTHHH